ncbi:TlpA family protein disulfide reductase [Ferrimonas lipolytica]|uniref:TlpA family protein disulfide reductase n=1 Tax=Ferrimonas lipolytica TaxID=2724191 RepID=A0A6H1UBI5_9GAMM|nr:TlpA disulfide reductase family protein [Ferrimonas lipolytica]QIZ76447.1 TlpA family protein disulfide reductase [Ferrimonas lipolytica]
MKAAISLVKTIVSYLIIGLLALWFGGMARGMMMAPVSGAIDTTPLPTLAGQPQQLTSGEPQLIYLFAPWCTICELTSPAVVKWQQQQRNVVAVAASYQHQAEVEAFVATHALDRTTVFLATEQLQQQLDLVAFPTFIIIDSDGSLISKRIGYSPEWLLSLYLNWYGI